MPHPFHVHGAGRFLILARDDVGAYVVFSLVLALVLGLTVLLHGVSMSAFLAIAIVWLVPTCLVARLRRRNARL